MPNRILRDWTDSLKFEQLSAEGERLFTRLLMKADDYGRFHADPRLIKAACFPLSDIVTSQVEKWLVELASVKLVFRYSAEGREYLAVVNFSQRLKDSVPKFPPPPGEENKFLATSAHSGNFPELPGTSRKDSPVSVIPIEVSDNSKNGTSRNFPELPASRARSNTSPSPSPSPIPNAREDLNSILRQYPKPGNPGTVMPIIAEAVRTNGYKEVMDGTKACAAAMRKAPGGAGNRMFPHAQKFFEERNYLFPDTFVQRSLDLSEVAAKGLIKNQERPETTPMIVDESYETLDEMMERKRKEWEVENDSSS